jgi:GntR family transcriptional regulator
VTSRCAAANGTPAFSPLYQQIKGLILQSLQRASGNRARPSQRNRAGRALRVSQGTVRKAIDELAADNLLVRRQGKGTFVATHAEQHMCNTASCACCPTPARLDAEGPAQRTIVECKRLRASADMARSWMLRAGDSGAPGAARMLSFAARRPSWKTSGCPAGPSRA